MCMVIVFVDEQKGPSGTKVFQLTVFVPESYSWRTRGKMTAEKENRSMNVNATIVTEDDDETKLQLMKGKWLLMDEC